MLSMGTFLCTVGSATASLNVHIGTTSCDLCLLLSMVLGNSNGYLLLTLASTVVLHKYNLQLKSYNLGLLVSSSRHDVEEESPTGIAAIDYEDRSDYQEDRL